MTEKDKTDFEKMLEESRRERNIEYLFRKHRAPYEKYSPYTVVIVDQFQGHDEDGYGDWAVKEDLASAIAEARRITEEAIGPSKNTAGWRGMGDAGLVYDAKGTLVWDGVIEYAEAGNIKELIEKDIGGIRRICKAVDFAAKAHSGQNRKGTDTPYVVHPFASAYSLLWRKCPPETVIAAVLHDTVEDTPVTLDVIKRFFGEEVAEIVKGVSEPDKNDTWENRKKHTLENLKTATINTLLVSIADKLDNIYAIHADYKREGDALWKRFNRSKEEQKWYYASLSEVIAQRKDSKTVIDMAGSFCEAVKEVFGSEVI